MTAASTPRSPPARAARVAIVDSEISLLAAERGRLLDGEGLPQVPPAAAVPRTVGSMRWAPPGAATAAIPWHDSRTTVGGASATGS